MTIQEAIRSGKLCRRKADSFGPNFGKLRHDNSHDRIVFEYVVCKLNGIKTTMPLIINDILADDWEIEWEPREIWVYENEKGEIYSLSETKPNSIDQRYSAKIVKFREVIE